MKTVIPGSLFPLVMHTLAGLLVQDEYHSTSTNLIIDDEANEVRLESIDTPPVVLFTENYYW